MTEPTTQSDGGDVILEEWKGMLQKEHSEHDYHGFLAKHAGLFLPRSIHDALVVSKLKLGSEFETDFVVVRDDFSFGLKYILIEIEIPTVRLFTTPGKPSDRLNTALGQINNWKQWIASHPNEARELFPSGKSGWNGPVIFEYMIIIGRRTESDENAKIDMDSQRAWRSLNDRVEIRTFDFLTSNALTRQAAYKHDQESPKSSRASSYPHDHIKPLNRVDWSALSHTEWRELIRNPQFQGFHLLEWNSKLVLEARSQQKFPLMQQDELGIKVIDLNTTD